MLEKQSVSFTLLLRLVKSSSSHNSAKERKLYTLITTLNSGIKVSGITLITFRYRRVESREIKTEFSHVAEDHPVLQGLPTGVTKRRQRASSLGRAFTQLRNPQRGLLECPNKL